MSRTTRFDFITVLRGVACLAVVMHHSFLGLQVPDGIAHYPIAVLAHVAEFGWLGVSAFLLVSGFCLYYPLVAERPPEEARLDLRRFAQRRLWRVLPPYYAALILFELFELWWACAQSSQWDWRAGLRGPGDGLLHLIMLFNLSPGSIASVNPAFWSLALECQLYLVFPLLVSAAARFGLHRMLLATAAIAIAWQLACFASLGLSTQWPPEFAVLYHALPGRCFEFAAGMMLADCIARPQPWQARRAWWLIVVCLPPAAWFITHVARFGPLIDQAVGVAFASAALLLSRLPERHFERNALLKGMAWLGTISFSVYLVHQPLIWFFDTRRLLLPATPNGAAAAAVLRIALMVFIGYVFHLAIERRFLAIAARPGRIDSLREAPPATVPAER